MKIKLTSSYSASNESLTLNWTISNTSIFDSCGIVRKNSNNDSQNKIAVKTGNQFTFTDAAMPY